MDPNATLRNIEESTRIATKKEFCEYLRDWINMGGFSPQWESYPNATQFYLNWNHSR